MVTDPSKIKAFLKDISRPRRRTTNTQGSQLWKRGMNERVLETMTPQQTGGGHSKMGKGTGERGKGKGERGKDGGWPGSLFCLTKRERPSANQNFWERKEAMRAIIDTRNIEERRPLAEAQ